ncbi:MAG: hypothetical protein N3F66_14240 [Spirochaetes bacterium]|nr:hypothetical protein [Spirochaetota bacterium]
MSYKYTEIRTDAAGNIDEIDVATANPSKNYFHGPALGVGIYQYTRLA